MPDPRYTTADGHPITDGGIYWDNNLDRVQVVFHHGRTPTTTEPYGTFWDGWFHTRPADTPDARPTGLSNNERLAVHHPMTGQRADKPSDATTTPGN